MSAGGRMQIATEGLLPPTPNLPTESSNATTTSSGNLPALDARRRGEPCLDTVPIPLPTRRSERWGSGGSSKRASCPALSYSVVSLEGAVRYGGSNLQHHMRSPRRPAHLLIRAHPAMKQPLHGAFRRRRRYWLDVVTRRRVVDDQFRLPGHVRLKTTQEIKNPRSKLRGISGRKEADHKNAASCGEYVPKEI
jgi:hypothetical protein